MKKFLVSATTAAVLSALSSGAFAVVNLNDGSGAVNYANQLVVPGTTALTGAGVNVTSKLGFGVSQLQQRFVRYDLTNAKFGAAGVLPANLVVTPGTVSNTVVSSGGSAGSTFVIFEITAGAGGLDQAADVNFASGTAGLVIQSAAAPVQVAYSLYQDAASAAAGGAGGRLSNASATVAGLVSGLAFSTAQNTTTVDVSSAGSTYTHFLTSVGGTTTNIAQIGTVSIGAATPVLDPITGVQVLYPAIVGAGTALVLKGDFGAAVSPSTTSAGVFLGVDGGNCGTAGTAPTPATPTPSASFTTGTTPAVAKPLCFTVTPTNSVKIPAQTFTVEADITAAAGSTATDLAPIDAGKFVRNGLVLKAAFAETTSASGVARAVSLSNTSNNPAPYTVRCLVNSPTVVVGTPGTVPALSSTRVQLGTPGMGCPTNGTLRGIEITFANVPGSVIGSVVSQNTSTGQASFDSMTGNQ